MTLIKKSLWRDRLLVLSLPALLVGGLMFAGCSNDPVAPQEQLPAVTADGAAHQAGFVALAAAAVGPQIIDFAGKSDKDSYSYTFPPASPVTGTVHMDFFAGGPEGTPVPWEESDYGTLFTADGEWLTIAVGYGGTITLTLDIEADLDRINNEATIIGGGTFASGPNTATFTFTDLVVAQGSSYPSSGVVTLVAGNHSVTVTFVGTNTAFLSVDGRSYTVNLDTGEVAEVDPF